MTVFSPSRKSAHGTGKERRKTHGQRKKKKTSDCYGFAILPVRRRIAVSYRQNWSVFFLSLSWNILVRLPADGFLPRCYRRAALLVSSSTPLLLLMHINWGLTNADSELFLFLLFGFLCCYCCCEFIVMEGVHLSRLVHGKFSCRFTLRYYVDRCSLKIIQMQMYI